MGNEMGNNNTTGLKEEESLAVEDPKGLPRETSSFDDVKGVVGSEDGDGKSNGLVSDNPEGVGEIPDQNQTLSIDEKEKSGVKPTEDPKALSKEISNLDYVKDVLGSEDNGFDKKSNGLNSDDLERIGEILDESQAPRQDVKEQSDDFAVVASLTEKPNGDPKGLSKETSSFDIVKGVIDSEDYDFHEKTEGLASDNPERVEEIPDESQTPNRDEKEQGDNVPVVDSLVVKRNEEDEGDQELSLTELNMDMTVENAVQKEVSPAKNGSESSNFDSISTPLNNLELESSELDRHGSHAEESVPDSNRSSDGTEQVLGSSFIGDNALEHLEVSIEAGSNAIIQTEISESLVEQTKEELCPEKFESEDGKELESGLSNIMESSNYPSNLGQKCEEVVPMEESLIRDDSSGSEFVPEASSEMNVVESEENNMEVSEETGLIGKASENEEELIHGVTATHPRDDSVTESESCDSNELLTDFIALKQNEGMGPINDSPSEDDKDSEDHEANAGNGPDSEIVTSKPNTANSSEKTAFTETENQPRQDHSADSILGSKCLIAETIVSETEETGPVGEATENGEEIIHGDKPAQPCGDSVKQVINPDIEEAKASEDHEAIAEIDPVSETAPSNLHTEKMAFTEVENPIIQDHSSDSIFSSRTLIAEILVSMNEIAYERAGPEELKRCVDIEKHEEISPDSKAPSRESIERSSTDSDRESVQYAQMRKSPSFSLDLQNQESEKTPLLFHDKDAITLVRHENAPKPIEEKESLELERSDSEMAKTPFLGFPKEDEESNNGGSSCTPRRQSRARKEAKKGASSSVTVTVSSSSSKGEKRRSKSSLFGNCMCCMIH